MALLRKIMAPGVRRRLQGTAPMLVVVLGTAPCAMGCGIQELDVATAPSSSVPGQVATGVPGRLPDMSTKPKPVEITYQGCAAEGDGGRQHVLTNT
jgi:hypothetical protein